jgi:hypothetical protein
LIVDQEPETLSHDRVVIGDEDSKKTRHDHAPSTVRAAVVGTRSTIVVPLPGADSI